MQAAPTAWHGLALAPTHARPPPALQYSQEEPYYNWNLPGFAEKTGHFTQLVWKETTQVGCGVTFCPPGPGSPFVIGGSKGVCVGGLFGACLLPGGAAGGPRRSHTLTPRRCAVAFTFLVCRCESVPTMRLVAFRAACCSREGGGEGSILSLTLAEACCHACVALRRLDPWQHPERRSRWCGRSARMRVLRARMHTAGRQARAPSPLPRLQ